MVPCGCGEEVTDMPTGKCWMRFIGYVDGKLVKGAPGNYRQGELVLQPYKLSTYPWWQLADEVPPLEAPEPVEADSVFMETVPDAEMPSSLKRMLGVQEGEMRLPDADEVTGFPVPPDEGDEALEEVTEELSREEVIAFLEDNGIEYNKHHSSDYLRKLMSEHDPQEDG